MKKKNELATRHSDDMTVDMTLTEELAFEEGYNRGITEMKKEIKRLETIRNKVFRMYAYTEGINEDLSKKALIDMLKHISLDIESVTNYIADEIGLLERSVN